MNSSDPFSFPIPESRGTKPSDPETLFRSLSQRSPRIQHLWSHQADILRSWHSDHIDTPDIALELPTGTGKTLIGLLIGDFVRQTREYRAAYLCPTRQLAHQVCQLALDYSIDARVLVGPQASYAPDDFNAFKEASAVAVTTYSAIFNIRPRIDSATLLILDDAHASEDYIASLWNVDISRDDHKDLYFSLLAFLQDVIPASQLWNLKSETAASARSECSKIPSYISHSRETELRSFLDSCLEGTDLKYSWRMIRGHLAACHIFVTWPSISIRPITPPTFSHAPFANARQRIYMSATLGEGGELERITGVRRIERLPVPQGWRREGTGRRFIMFPDRSLPGETATDAAVTMIGRPTRSLVLTPNRYVAQTVIERLNSLTPSPVILSASDVETSLEPFLRHDHAALVLHNRYDGLDLPGDACHLEWICGLPGATNAQEAFLLNRLGVHSVLRDRIRTRLTQALGRCTRNPTDHALVIVSGPNALDFCIKSENRSGFHPELQAEIQYGLQASEVQWPGQFVDRAQAFLERRPGWQGVDQWIREQRDVYSQLKDEVAATLMDNVQDEIDYAAALWVGDFQGALEKSRACADRLGGDVHANYRAWWYYLAASAAALSMTRDNLERLRDTARELLSRACAASPRTTWFRECARLVDFEVSYEPVDDPLLLTAAEAIERRIQQVGVAGAGFENEAKVMIDLLDSPEATDFEQGLQQLGLWLGTATARPTGIGVPDGVWSFGEETIVVFEAKSNERPVGTISLNTAREAQGHRNWIESNMQVASRTSILSAIVSDRTTLAREAVPNASGLFVVSLACVRQLGRRVVSTVRALRAQATEARGEEFRHAIAQRLENEELDPKSILATLQSNPLDDFPV